MSLSFILGDNSYWFEWICDVGTSDAVKWSWACDRQGEFPVRFRVHNGNTLVDEETSVIKAVPKVSTAEKNLLTIGNSLTTGGFNEQFGQIIQDVDIPLNPIGTQGTVYPHEGHGGWTFSRFLGGESPFYVNGKIDLQNYIQSNALPVPDIIRIFLGINDCFSDDPMDSIYQSADQLIRDIETAFPEALIFIAMPTLCKNSGDAWIQEYGNLNNYYPYQLRIRQLWKYFLENYSGQRGSGNTRVSYDGLCIDRDQGYPFIDSGYFTMTLHPNSTGYKQLTRGFSNELNYAFYLEEYAQGRREPVVKVYPNPCTGPLNIIFKHDHDSPVRVLFHNSAGKLVLDQLIPKTDFFPKGVHFQVPPDIAPGIYMVTVLTDKRIGSASLVIER